MTKFDEIIESLSAVIQNPEKVVQDYKEKTGKGAIGCFPIYTPEPLVHAAGYLPVGVWASHQESELVKQYFPAFACPIMASNLELGLRGKFDCLSAVIIPCMCDTLICTGQNWKRAIPQVPYIGFVHPQNRKMKAGMDFLIAEYTTVKEKIEAVTGEKITNEALMNSIKIHNEHNEAMRQFIETAADYPSEITPSVRNIVFKSAQFMLKEEHTAKVKELVDELKKKTPQPFDGLKVLVSGISDDSEDLFKVFDDNKIAVVADDLAQCTRQYRSDIPLDSENPIENLANAWRIFEGCSLAYDPKKTRGKMIAEDCKKFKADGVIFCMMKFCDPEEYDYPIINKMVTDAGIPTAYIEYNSQSVVDEQIRTRIQTFAEILSANKI